MTLESRRLLLLVAELQRELDTIDAVVREGQDLLAAVGDRPADRFELRAAGSILNDFYTGIERMLTRVAREVDGGVPEGEEWHRNLLLQMNLEISRVRPAVLTPTTCQRLAEYLRFRHLFRHLYGFQLEWYRTQPLLEGASDLWTEVRAELGGFREFLLECSTALEDEIP